MRGLTGIEGMIRKNFDDAIMTTKTLKMVFMAKKGEGGFNVSSVVLGLAICLLFVVVVFILIKKWNPNAPRVASCLTDTAKIGPFA